MHRKVGLITDIRMEKKLDYARNNISGATHRQVCSVQAGTDRNYSLLFSILKLLHNYTYYDEFESLLSSGQSQWTGDMGHVDVGQHAVKSPGNRSFPR